MPWNPKTIHINSSDVTVLMWQNARYTGGLKPFEDRWKDHVKNLWVENWTALDDSLAWQVDVPRPGEYAISILYACRRGAEGSQVEIASADSKLGAIVRCTSNTWLDAPFDRVPLESTLSLPAGTSTITLRATRTPDSAPEVMKLFSLELSPLAAQIELEDKRRRAEALRVSTDWFVAAKYGLMITWSRQSYPRRGPRKPFQEAVRDFDVRAFAANVAETGAGYVIFTTSHGPMWFIAPNQAIERILSSRTAQRDLIADLADALGERGIRLILYYHTGIGESEWMRACGYDEEDMSRYWENHIEILGEISLHYGKRIAGFFVDDGYLYYSFSAPWERITRALKTGNPESIIGYNPWIYPRLTEFQDYWCGESGGTLMPLPEPECFAPGGWQGGLQAHLNPFLDDPWGHYEPNADIHAPLFMDEELIGYVRRCVAGRAVPSLNLGVYQDGTFSPATLEQMRALRRAIKGK